MAREPAIVILAGGQSRRMGVDKARLVIDGEPLLAQLCSRLNGVGPITIVGGEPSLLEILTIDAAHLPDRYPGEGPLGGLLTALQRLSGQDVAIVMACDLPNLDEWTVRHIYGEHIRTVADITVPILNGEEQWHVSAWSTSLREDLAARFAGGERSLRRAAKGWRRTSVVTAHPRVYEDLDTPTDIARFVAREASSQERPAT